MTRFIALALVMVSTAASAGEDPTPAPPPPSGDSGFSAGGMTSVLSGKTLRSGKALHLQLGWPGAMATLLVAVAQQLDLGGRVALLYGYEGLTRIAGVPGFKVEGVLRVQLFEKGKINLGLKVNPGLFLYFFPGFTDVGLTLPVSVAFGVAVSPKLMVNAGVDLPIFVTFGPGGGVSVPFLFGGGIEFALDNRLALTGSLKTGPLLPLGAPAYFGCYDGNGRAIRCGAVYSFSHLVLEALFGLSIRL
jgi:hypothetical protein